MLLIVFISNNGTSIVLEVLSLMKISLKKGEIEKKFQKLGRAQHTIKLYAHTSGYGLTIAAARVRCCRVSLKRICTLMMYLCVVNVHLLWNMLEVT